MNYLAFLRIVFLVLIVVRVDQSRDLNCYLGSNVTKLGDTLNIGCKTSNRGICLYNVSHHAWQFGTEHVVFRGSYELHHHGRYKEQIQSCTEMTLLIHNFSLFDLDKKTMCEVKDQTCQFVASKDAIKFTYIPRETEIHISHNESVSNVSVTASIDRIYPPPNCFFQLQNEDMRNKTDEKIFANGHFHSADYFLSYNNAELQCPVHISFKCNFGNHTRFMINESTNCTVPEDDIGDIHFVFCSQCIVILIMTLAVLTLLLWSIARNGRGIIQLIKELPDRKVRDLRRPVLGFAFTLACLVLSFWSGFFSIEEITRRDTSYSETRELVLALTSLLLTPFSLGCLSNPTTESIRAGFRKAGGNFLQRVENVKRCSLKGFSKFNDLGPVDPLSNRKLTPATEESKEKEESSQNVESNSLLCDINCNR